MEIKVIDGVCKFEDLVGHRFKYLDRNIRIYEFDSNAGNLKFAIDLNGNGIDEITEEISLSLGLDRFLNILKNNYGIDINLVVSFSYSTDTTNKVQGLIQAGFAKLIRVDNNYMVDNLFLQNFLLENELDYLLQNNIEEIELSKIE